MKAGILFSGTGPIMILTSYASFGDPDFTEKLVSKGIKKFIAFEVDVELVQKKYGQHFHIVMGDLNQSDDLRVLDYDGHHIFNNFSLRELGEPIYYEPADG
jgi:hypothetical protein